MRFTHRKIVISSTRVSTHAQSDFLVSETETETEIVSVNQYTSSS